ncbi:hypothetical protein K0B96_10435 [Horticoccus luteus]|uniref:DUF6250 domain-containing protein n=1 Tax=Horticoccus luteus TaxID=2862869 RepID=A0A8F9TTD4_9BACT|nr:DUF6250 domain-containing protein [Horticoccus luteus]QYM77742.1 hypothetical protein K0B96_10435 [Horticoccus luteus]
MPLRYLFATLLLGTLAHAASDGTVPFTPDLNDWLVEQMPGGHVTVANGALVIEDVDGCTVWYRHRLVAPVEITYDAEVVMHGGPCDRLSDLNCFWMADTPREPAGLIASTAHRTGRFTDYDSLATYYVGYGGNENTTTRFRRYTGTGARPLLPQHDLRAPAILLTANRVYHLKLVARDGRAEFWRDGERIFSYADPAPLRSGYFGFRTVKSHLIIRNVHITTAGDETLAPHAR